jgi:16S rRNA (guanine(1405)-N(7))-methyltransferase
MSIDPQAVSQALEHAPKYRGICKDTLGRIVSWAIMRSKSPKEAVKRAKRKLHQVYGAYVEEWDTRRLEELLNVLAGVQGAEERKKICREILFQHASTRERLQTLDSFYSGLFALTGRPKRLLDIGCGLHPFAIPWMGIPRDCEYLALDIDTRIVSAIGRFFTIVGQAGQARCQDTIVTMPDDPVDVAFLFKLLPCLEQQESGHAVRLLQALRADWLVVTFPVLSISGKNKGMRAFYAQLMDQLQVACPWPTKTLELQQELVFIMEKNAGHK